MSDKFKIGIVGHGFVGQAVDYAFTNPIVEKFYVDPKYGTNIDNLVEWQPHMTFVCAPTPMMSNGAMDATIVNDAVLKLIEHTNSGIAIKSTVTPDVIKNLMVTVAFKDAINRVVYNPEFLTENSAKEQFIHAPFHVFGGSPQAVEGLVSVYNMFSMCTMNNVFRTAPVEAAFIKYAINSFMATKVTFFNQLYDAATGMGASFNNIIAGLEQDPRMGKSHMRVPGFDGKRGFGGACLPKDTSAFNHAFKGFTLLEKVITINNEYRSQYDLDEREKTNNVNYGQAEKE
jgi:nucleotide sugar dehydrogenase